MTTTEIADVKTSVPKIQTVISFYLFIFCYYLFYFIFFVIFIFFIFFLLHSPIAFGNAFSPSSGFAIQIDTRECDGEAFKARL